MTPDGLPFVGKVPGNDRLYLATGFGGTGLTWGSLAGEILAAECLDRIGDVIIVFRVSDERPVPLTVETGGTPWALHVDGERTFHDTAPVSRRYFSLRLSPGWHTVSVKLGVAGSNHVQVALPGVSFYEGEPRQAPRPAPGSVSLEERKLAPLPVAQTRVQGALRALLGMQQAYFSGDTDEGLALAEAHVSETPRFSALRTVYANLLLADPNRPDRLARDRARSQLKVALLHNPNLLTARLAYARLLLQDEKAALAQEVLDANPQTRLVDMGVIPNQALQLAAAPF